MGFTHSAVGQSTPQHLIQRKLAVLNSSFILPPASQAVKVASTQASMYVMWFVKFELVWKEQQQRFIVSVE